MPTALSRKEYSIQMTKITKNLGDACYDTFIERKKKQKILAEIIQRWEILMGELMNDEANILW